MLTIQKRFHLPVIHFFYDSNLKSFTSLISAESNYRSSGFREEVKLRPESLAEYTRERTGKPLSGFIDIRVVCREIADSTISYLKYHRILPWFQSVRVVADLASW
jgi:hypothetical protein